MFMIIIAVIAAAILVYFSFFSGRQVSEPELRDETGEESLINAAVSGKRVGKSQRRRTYFILYYVEFECEDGEFREFSVGPTIYEAVEIGDRDTLVYAGVQFVGFGDHGAIAVEGEPEVEDDGFTYEDYDESIDMEQDVELPAASGLDPENEELLEQFRSREKLPAKTETVGDEGPLAEYSALTLLEKMTIYPFLKREDAVRRIFRRTFDEAMSDLRGFEGDSRKGRAADSVIINRNEIRVTITLEENPRPLEDRVTAEFGVND